MKLRFSKRMVNFYTLPKRMQDYIYNNLNIEDSGDYRGGSLFKISVNQKRHINMLLVLDGKTPVAWGIICQVYGQTMNMFFVAAPYRRKGVGTRIAKRMQALTGRRTIGDPWNTQARLFFMSIKAVTC